MKKFVKGSVVALAATLICLFSAGGRESHARPAIEAIPGGYTVGLKLYLDGLLVVGTSDINTSKGSFCPGKIAGVSKGDRITKINGEEIESVAQFCSEIQKSRGEEIEVEVIKGDNVEVVEITPALYTETGDFKIGLWVRDSAAGIGTVTYVFPDGSFAALGHGISDVDTGTLVSVKEGKVTGSSVCSVLKGEVGAPGDLRGIFEPGINGTVDKNTSHGIFGKLSEKVNEKAIPVALRDEVSPGKATILANVEGKNVSEYEVEIESISLFRGKSEKNMIVKVTDERLLGKTGGIVQGMSGSPILQNGRIVGAVTHVFVNDPTRGYGIFIENMLAEAKKIK